MATDTRDRETVPGPGSVDEAINRVLFAEREAREAVERCRGEAARIVAEAENRAARIRRRTEGRIKAAHRSADKAVEAALRELSGAGRDGRAGGGQAPDQSRLEQAVQRLVDEILGGQA